MKVNMDIYTKNWNVSPKLRNALLVVRRRNGKLETWDHGNVTKTRLLFPRVTRRPEHTVTVRIPTHTGLCCCFKCSTCFYNQGFLRICLQIRVWAIAKELAARKSIKNWDKQTRLSTEYRALIKFTYLQLPPLPEISKKNPNNPCLFSIGTFLVVRLSFSFSTCNGYLRV